MNNTDGWHHINMAPRNKRVIVWTGQEKYIAHWVQHPATGDEAWCISQGPDGTQHLCHPTLWRGAPCDPVESLPDDPE